MPLNAQLTCLNNTEQGSVYTIDLLDGKQRKLSAVELTNKLYPDGPQMQVTAKELPVRINTKFTLWYPAKVVATAERTGRTTLTIRFEDGTVEEQVPASVVRACRTPAAATNDVTADTQCSICLCPLGQQAVQLPCGHAYHKQCIAKCNWPSCPLCRHRFRARGLVDIRITEQGAAAETLSRLERQRVDQVTAILYD